MLFKVDTQMVRFGLSINLNLAASKKEYEKNMVENECHVMCLFVQRKTLLITQT